MPPPESGSPLILVGFAVFNRVMQLASRGECDRARVGSSLVDFEGIFFFFFCIFGKSYAHGRRETKKIITVALSSVLSWEVCACVRACVRVCSCVCVCSCARVHVVQLSFQTSINGHSNTRTHKKLKICNSHWATISVTSNSQSSQ